MGRKLEYKISAAGQPSLQTFCILSFWAGNLVERYLSASLVDRNMLSVEGKPASYLRVHTDMCFIDATELLCGLFTYVFRRELSLEASLRGTQTPNLRQPTECSVCVCVRNNC